MLPRELANLAWAFTTLRLENESMGFFFRQRFAFSRTACIMHAEKPYHAGHVSTPFPQKSRCFGVFAGASIATDLFLQCCGLLPPRHCRCLGRWTWRPWRRASPWPRCWTAKLARPWGGRQKNSVPCIKIRWKVRHQNVLGTCFAVVEGCSFRR